MIDLLIIDDIQWIREAIEGMLQDFPEEINIIGSVADGEEALEIISKVAPHLVITDISMPGMDGLELSKRVKEMYPQIKVILISGFDEFEYAKKAIQLRVDDYILKPIDKVVLHKAISKAVQEIEKENKQQLRNKDLFYKLKTADQFLKENEIYKVIESNQDISEEFIERYFGKRQERFIIFAIKIRGFYKVVDERYCGDTEVVKFSIKNIVENLIKEDYYFFFSYQKEDECILIRYGANISDENQELNFVNKLKIILEKYTCMKMSIGLSPIGSDIKELKLRYEEAEYALMHRLLGGSSASYCYSVVNSRTNMKDIMSKNEEKLIYLAAKNNEIVKVKEAISCLFDKLRNDSNASISSLQNLYTSLVLLFNRLLIEVQGSYAVSTGLWLINNRNLGDFDDLSDLQEEIERAFEVLSEGIIIMQKKASKKGNIAEMVMEYLNEHYSEEISLTEISKIYYINSCYLSQLFKAETNQTFSQYLTRLRMEKAREILEQGNTKIYDVAIHVGYEYVSHFIQSFKKVYGVTPDQLRKSQQS